MGALFRLEHANLMAYITSQSSGPPRVLRGDLVEFLQTLAYHSEYYLVSEPNFRSWPEQIGAVARESLARLSDNNTSGSDSILVPPPMVGRLLENLRFELATFPLYALALGNDERVRTAAMELASVSMHGQLLVLIPEGGRQGRDLEIIDPLPVFSGALHAALSGPGFQFWTPTGVSAFARLDEVQTLFCRLRDAMHEKRHCHPFSSFPSCFGFDHVLRDWSQQNPSPSKRLLHLSDLHFGTSDATENQALLDAELREVVGSVDRVVITGDLINTPREDYAAVFMNFRNTLVHLARGREPILVTGNHDQRMSGLFGDDYRQIVTLGGPTIEADDQCAMAFICFNSSEGGTFARGRIPQSQFRRRGAEYRALIAARPELKDYLPIVLVHHHPFSFDVPPETLVQRALAAIGLRDESFLAMADAGNLHQWCLDWEIGTILHGHKHKARYMTRKIMRHDHNIELAAIGCGSSLGVRGVPLSYDLLEWDAGTKQWIVSFLESVNGGAFRETVVSRFTKQ